MVRLTDFKKGQRVRYVAYNQAEDGVISSTNDFYVFVKFDNKIMTMVTGDEPYTAQACKPEDLEIIDNEL